MNTSPHLGFSRRISLVVFAAVTIGLGALVAGPASDAVPASGSGKGVPVGAPAGVDSARSKALRSAFENVKQGDIDGAERSLASASPFTSGSPEFDLDAAAQLTQLGTAMAREGRPDRTAELAKRALKHADQAAARSSTARARAQASAHAGFIREKLMGDIPGAIASYEDAVKADPTDRGARERLEHLKEMDALLRARLEAAKKE